MNDYLRQFFRESEEAKEKARRLEAAIMEAEAIGDLTRLNKLAASEARTATAKGFSFKDIFELLDGRLPTIAGAMSFKYRVELCAYLGFLKKERGRLIEQVPSEWQGKRIKQLMHKEKEIELLLNGETDYEVNNDTESQAVTDSASAKVIKLNGNDIEFSGLLNIPKKIDDWFEVIDAMAKDFFNENGTIPTKAQAWSKLWASPPDSYEITTGKDRGENCLKMADLTLTKRNFNERWKSYTTPKSE